MPLTKKTFIEAITEYRFFILVFLASMCLRILIPPYIVVNSPNDDFLGVMLAHSLIQGHWLGAWTPDLLSKPPAYPFYLAIVHFFRISPTIPMHVFYLAASFYVTSIILKNSPISSIFRRNLKKMVFLILAFNPAVFAGDFSKIYRISFSVVLVVAYFGLLFDLANRVNEYLNSKVQAPQFSNLFKKFWKPSMSLGFLYAISVLNRFESYWILVPSLVLLFIILITGSDFRIHFSNIHILSPRNLLRARLAGVLVLIGVVSYLIPIEVVSSTNKAVYGVSEIENFYSGNFAKAIKLWESVQNGKSPYSFIAVSRGQRDAIYPYSPAARQLSVVLDSSPNTGWKTFNCSMTRICDESGIWFPWELRTAAAQTGQIHNEQDFQRFFAGLSNEIEAACIHKQVKCGRLGSGPGSKAILDYPKHQIFNGLFKCLLSILNFDQVANLNRPDTGQNPGQLQIWRETIDFKYAVTSDNSTNWMALSDVIVFLKTIYIPLTDFLLVIALICLIIFWNRLRLLLRWFSIAILVGVLIFSLGLSMVEAASGFTIAYSLYALPIQPLVFLFIAVVGIAVCEVCKPSEK